MPVTTKMTLEFYEGIYHNIGDFYDLEIRLVDAEGTKNHSEPTKTSSRP